MSKEPATFNWADAFEEVARDTARQNDEADAFAQTPAGIAKRKAEIEKEIRQGLRDANGDWIDQPESEDEEDEDEDCEDDDEA